MEEVMIFGEVVKVELESETHIYKK